jgi:hypothetical protein
MMKKYLYTAILLLFVVCNLLAQTSTPPAAGNGSENSPYEIETLDNLYWLSQNSTEWDSYFIQTANINAKETRTWDVGDHDGDVGTPETAMGFSPIGNNPNLFRGSYNGQGYSIDSLFINRVNTDYIGLFGYALEAHFDSLSLTNVNFSGKYFLGAIVGWGESIIISNSNSSGSINSTVGYSGGLLGLTSNSSIFNCNSSCSVINSYSGGLIGELRCSGSAYTSKVSNCYSTGSVSNGSRIGGLIGNTSGSTSDISNCYSNSDVNGTSRVGGLVGLMCCNMVNCYSTGSVNGTSEVGGLVGLNSGKISNSFSTGEVIGSNTDIGGLVGLNSGPGTINKSFWDTQTSLQTTSSGGIGLSTSEMKKMCVFADSTWDFMGETVNGTDDIWGMKESINGGYPFLSWQGYSHTAECCGYTADVTPPDTPILADVTGECSATAIAPTTTDNCSGIITGSTTDPLTYDVQGTYTITWKFDDGNGNSIEVDQNIVIDDNTAPIADEATLLDVTAECEVTALTVPTATDNCAGAITGSI